MRPLRGDQELVQAAEILAAEWDKEHAKEFLQEVTELKNYPGSEVFGVTNGGRILGVGVVLKALHHPQAWSRAWIVLDRSIRGGDYGTKLIQTLTHHAESLHSSFSNGPMVMEGGTSATTVAPEYYEKFGNRIVAERLESKGRKTWTMRVTGPVELILK